MNSAEEEFRTLVRKVRDSHRMGLGTFREYVVQIVDVECLKTELDVAGVARAWRDVGYGGMLDIIGEEWE